MRQAITILPAAITELLEVCSSYSHLIIFFDFSSL
jgi:hypothetical protein